MGIRLRHKDLVIPGSAAIPGAKTSHGAGLARTLRTRWWPRFALAGVLLVVIGVTLLSGTAEGAAVMLGVAVFLFAAVQGLSGKGYTREPPVPPGSGGSIGV